MKKSGAIYKALLISAKSPKKLKIYNPGFLVISPEGIIENISKKDPRKKLKNYSFHDYSGFLICPGFIDTHNHLSQYSFAGLEGQELLTWLKTYAFPEEKKFKDQKIAQIAAQNFFQELIRNGTTTTLTYITTHKIATDIAFQQAQKSKIRAIIGKVMMDQNSPRFLIEKTAQSLKDSLELIDKWHNKDGRLFYALTPRFAITCSRKLMQDIGKIAQEKNVYVQTHLSENHQEIQITQKLFPQYKSYTDIYYQTGLLCPRTILAHCIHLTSTEIQLIKKTQSKIAHCPTSNRFLMSGIMPFRKYQNLNLQMSLGTDVAGGYSLSMLNEMREAIENSKTVILFQGKKNIPPMTITEAFYLATLGGAKNLSLQSQIGSLEKGKQADFLITDPISIDPMRDKSPYQNPIQLLSKLIYRGNNSVIKEVYIKGEKIMIYKKHQSLLRNPHFSAKSS
ncbi:MAG: guanine deaminase, guanine deaminase [Candidatus Peregrinibacteria bacterium GW2011_GWE2_39_6]|nr:MAG: guanine deaminase, guanine deaminase [Candidatus Peregrinibacteria bacterium GW2011_GWF2_39_17]KKR26080.1 MAG: guanine deaminase, guanine deaminase [Candidatus Peregrinibacteria bacterium GW2011_GWE2_39_6]